MALLAARRAGMSRGHCVTVPEVIALAPVISVAGCGRARRHVTPGGAGRRPRHACCVYRDPALHRPVMPDGRVPGWASSMPFGASPL
jgi:hypothetical protein